MPWLQLTLEVRDVPVEERLCRVGHELWVGDHPRSVVSFPAGPVRARACGHGVLFDGRLLVPGRGMIWRHGPYAVKVEVAEIRSTARFAPQLPDPRMLVASAAIILFGSWLESMQQVVSAHPEAVRRVHAMLRPSLQDFPVPFGWPLAETPPPQLPRGARPDEPPAQARPEEWPPAVRYAPEARREPAD